MPITEIAIKNAGKLGIFPERLEHLEKKMRQWIDTDKEGQGNVVRIMRCGEEIFNGAYGFARTDPEKIPMTLDTIYPVASFTKAIIAALIMQFQEDGEIDVCHDVQRYLPDFTGKNGVTILHCLTHTSGLNDEKMYETVKAFIRDQLLINLPENEDDDDAWREVFLRAAKILNITADESNPWVGWEISQKIGNRLPYAHPPGQVMEYNSHVYDLCKDILVKISGKPIDEIARERLFKPLGMTDSYFILPEDKWDRVMHPGEGTMGYPWQGRDRRNLTSEHGGGGLKSTSGDIIKFCEMIRCEGIFNGKRVMSPMSVRAMCKNYNGHIKNEYSAWAIGFNYHGSKIDDSGILRPAAAVDHGGYAGAKMQIDKENELTFTFLNISYTNKPEYNIHSRFINTVYSCLSR